MQIMTTSWPDVWDHKLLVTWTLDDLGKYDSESPTKWHEMCNSSKDNWVVLNKMEQKLFIMITNALRIFEIGVANQG